MPMLLLTDWKISSRLIINNIKCPVLFADRDLYNPTTFNYGIFARLVGMQTSRGCAEFGRREREAKRLEPPCFNAGYFKHITAVRDSFTLNRLFHI